MRSRVRGAKPYNPPSSPTGWLTLTCVTPAQCYTGPKAHAALQALTDLDLTKFAFMRNTRATVAGLRDVNVTRCGYTGEDGFEVSLPAAHVVGVVEELLRNPVVQLAGLAARDSLRLEAGLCLYGNDIDEATGPVASRYTWCIDKTKTNYLGAGVIVPTLPNKTATFRVGLSTVGRAARQGAKIFDAAGKQVGVVTSGGQSPTLKKCISMGYVDRVRACVRACCIPWCRAGRTCRGVAGSAHRAMVAQTLSKVGTELFVEISGKKQAAVIEKLPFVECHYYKPQ